MPILRSASFVGLGLLFATLASCSSTDDAPSSTAAAKPAPGFRAAASRVSAETLAQHGLEEVWYLPDIQASGGSVGVQNTFLLPEGLFLVTLVPPGPDGARSNDKHLIRLNRQTGEAIWYEEIRVGLDHPPFIYRYPTGVDRDTEALFLQGDEVVCLDLASGNRMWSKTVQLPVATGLCADDRFVFLGSESRRAFAVEKRQSIDSWTYWTQSQIEARPILAGEQVIIASHDGFVRGLQPALGWDTQNSWEFEAGAKIVATPTHFGRYLFVGSADYKLYCLRLDGSVAWSFQAEAPVVDETVIYRVRPNREVAFCLADKDPLGRSPRRLFAVPLPKGDGAARVDALWHADDIRKVVALGQKNVYVLLEPDARGGARVLAALDAETGEERFRIDLGGFNFVPTNGADFGRDPKERGVIYLLSQSGEIQVIREKMR